MQRRKAAAGFTLLEMLVVIVIIAILVGLLMPALAAARRNSKNAATKATMHNLKIALENYRLDAGTYPITPTGTGMVYDTGGGAYNPGYYGTSASPYDHPCAAVGASPTGAETNKKLCDVLIKTRFLDIQKNNVISGELKDYFGVPLIIRILVVPPGAGTAEKLTEKVYIWSYGSDSKNAVNAAAAYINQGLPTYDTTESNNIEGSPAQKDDDITTWR